MPEKENFSSRESVDIWQMLFHSSEDRKVHNRVLTKVQPILNQKSSQEAVFSEKMFSENSPKKLVQT